MTRHEAKTRVLKLLCHFTMVAGPEGWSVVAHRAGQAAHVFTCEDPGFGTVSPDWMFEKEAKFRLAQLNTGEIAMPLFLEWI